MILNSDTKSAYSACPIAQVPTTDAVEVTDALNHLSLEASLSGFHRHFTVVNTTNISVLIYSLNGEHIGTVSPDHQNRGPYCTDSSITVFAQQTLTQKAPKGGARTKSEYSDRKTTYRKIDLFQLYDGPIIVPEAQIVLCVATHVPFIKTFESTISSILKTGSTPGNPSSSHPFVVYCNKAGRKDIGKWVYVSINRGACIIRAPVMNSTWMPPDHLFCVAEIRDPETDQFIEVGMETTFTELADNDGVAYTERVPSAVLHFSFDYDLLKTYLSVSPAITEPAPIVDAETPEYVHRDVVANQIKIATLKLKCELNTSETLRCETVEENRRLESELKVVSDGFAKMKKRMSETYDPETIRLKWEEAEEERREKKEDRAEERKDRRRKSRLNYVTDALKLVSVAIGVAYTLRGPIISGLRILSRWVPWLNNILPDEEEK